MDPYRKVQSGEKLKIHAQAWNRMLDSISTKPGNSAGGLEYHSAPYTWVYCKNATGSTVNRWGVMAITGVEITPTSTAGGATAEFERMPVLTGSTVTNTTTGWCVAVEPIENNKIGRVAIAGAVQVKAADLPKVARFAVVWKNSDWALIVMHPGTRLGTISANWNKGATATVTEQSGDGTAISPTVTFTAKNYFADVTVPSQSTRRVACAQIGSTWVLIAAEC